MTESDKKFIAEWEASKKLGWVKYSLIHGFSANLIYFVLNGLLLLGTNSLIEAFLSQEAFIRFMVYLPLLMLGQAFVMWPVHEWTYKRKIKTEKETRLIPTLENKTNIDNIVIPKKVSPFIVKERSLFSKK